MAKKVPTRIVPTALSAEARNFVLQSQPVEPPHASVRPPPPEAPAASPPAAVSAPASAAPRARRRGSRAVISRADGRTLRRLQVYLDADVAKRLKLHCVEQDVDMSAYVNDVLARALR